MDMMPFIVISCVWLYLERSFYVCVFLVFQEESANVRNFGCTYLKLLIALLCVIPARVTMPARVLVSRINILPEFRYEL